MKQTATFSAELTELRAMLDWIRNLLSDAGYLSATVRKAELASEEALVNIIRHAYKQGEGKIKIHVEIFPKDRVEIAILDKGPPFNPLLEETEIDASIPLEEREEGGLGILLMRQYMDEVLYKRERGSNVLTLIKRFP